MAQDTSLLERFAPAILASIGAEPLKGSQLRGALTIWASNGLEVVYAPFEHIAVGARLVIVGITPGLSQANIAIASVRSHLKAGSSPTEALRLTKQAASFSGSIMRTNLVNMLDLIGVHRLFGIPTSGALFAAGGEQVHFTSALRNPVFRNGDNYNGAPDMIRTPMLCKMMEQGLLEEIRALPDAIWLPLGPKPATALAHLASKGYLSPSRILNGVPHPSGANGEPIALFLGRKRPEDASLRADAKQIARARDALIHKIAALVLEGNA